MEVAAGQGLGQRGERGAGEVGVVALGLAGQGGVQGVVEVVVPLGVQPEAVLGARGDHPGVVEVGLRDQEQRAAHLLAQGVDRLRQLLQEVPGAVVVQGVHGVQAESVEAVVPQPGQGAVAEVGAHLVRAGRVQVHGGAPGGLVRVREVRSERGELVAGGAQVVVDHVQDDTEAQFMCPVHEPLQRLRPAVRLVHRPRRDPVVPPAVPTGEGAQRHQLDVGDAQFLQMAEPVGGRVQRALGGVRAHVQLVQHRARQPAPRPVGAPLVPVLVHDRAQPVRAVREAARARVGQDGAVVQREAVPRAVRRVRLRRPPARPLRIGFHRPRGALALERDPVCLWCPHLELHGRFPFVCSP